jgi:phosphatidylglycerol:prolipoprotein diacylglycerol transferase
LFVILWLFARRTRPIMAVSGAFLLGYGVFRFAVEFVRVPDPQLGYLAFGWLTMGQVLSAPMILAGLGLLGYAYRRAGPAAAAARGDRKRRRART